MNCQIEFAGVTFDIEYHVDDEGDYDQFDIEVGGQIMNDVLSQKTLDALETKVWEQDYLPGCQEHNDEMKIARYETSLEY